MRVSSVSFGTGAARVPKSNNERILSEFAYRPIENRSKPISATNGFRILLGIAAIAVAITLSRLKMPFKKPQMDLKNILC